METQENTLTLEEFAANIETHKADWIELLTFLQKSIREGDQTTINGYNGPEDDPIFPGFDITIATTDGETWGYQTGDNSYTGGAYHFRHWAVIYLYRDSNINQLVDDVMDQLCDLFYS